MGIQLNYTDEHSEQYLTSYWKPVQINFSEGDNAANIVFYGYKDAASKGKRIIGQKQYTLDADKVTKYLKAAPKDATTVRGALLSAAYTLAKETFDRDISSNEKPDMVSFFEGGIDV